jgi:5'-nucleotidase
MHQRHLMARNANSFIKVSKGEGNCVSLVMALYVLLLSTSALCADSEVVRLTILHLNDVYEMEPVENGLHGGLARVATIRRQVLAESPHTLLVLAGDTISPSVASSVSKGAHAIAVWNAVGLDLAVPGNHEFDFGRDVLLERIKESHFSWVATNITDSLSNAPLIGTELFVIRAIGEMTIGFLGMTTPETERLSNSAGVQFEDPCDAARRMTPKMRELGAQIIIGMTHLPMSRDKELASCADLDVIIGGHEHFPLQSMVGHTPILKVGSDARILGRLDLFLDAETGRIASIDWAMIPVTADIPEAPDVAKVVTSSIAGQAQDQRRAVLGHSVTTLDARQNANRTGETNLGDLIAEAYRRATDAEIGLVNGGTIRSDRLYGPGPITKADVDAILPFNNPIVAVELSGQAIRAGIEHGLSKVGAAKADGRFLQVAGIKFRYAPERPSGSRLIDIHVGGETLDDRKRYVVAMSRYLADGGDGYEMFRGARYLVPPEQGLNEAAALMRCIEELQNVDIKTDNRIVQMTAIP